MRAIFLGVTAALLTGATPATASVLSLGSGYAATCYRSAEARVADRNAFYSCDQALSNEALIVHDRVGTLVNRGILRMIGGNLEAANRDFDAALALDASEPEAWLNKAIAHLKAGKSQEALPMVDKAIELNTKKLAMAYYVRGLANEDTGNLKAAYSDLRRAQQLAPKWRYPRFELARYQVRGQ